MLERSRLENVRIEQMRRTRPKLVACLLMAMLMFVGTSSQALASLLCQTESCPKKAAQARELEQKSCCPKTADKSSEEEKDGCCCKIQSAPDLADSTVKVMVPQAPLVLALLGTESVLIELPRNQIRGEIPSYADLSPPNAPIARDRGRAPPVA